MFLRLEDVDSTRCTPARASEMRDALEWLGVDWDDEFLQSDSRAFHEDALDQLASRDLLYPCTCSRSVVKQSGQRAADGGWRYPGSCRDRKLPAGSWRESNEVIRLRLAPENIELHDEGGMDLSQSPAAAMGDPVLRNRDASIAYHLVCVVDDSRQGVTRVIRGRDLAASTATHVLMQRTLGLQTPIYRHHFLLLEETGGKLAKFHGAVGWREFCGHYTAEKLCGFLAEGIGLRSNAAPVRPRELLSDFSWNRVRTSDLVVRWTGRELEFLGEP